MNQTQPEERRDSTRAPISIAVKQRVGPRVVLCQANDISTGGMFIASVLDPWRARRAARPGKCWLEFSLPGSDVLIAARAETVRQFVHARFLLTAVRFAAIAPSHRRLIGRYVKGPPVASPVPSFLPV